MISIQEACKIHDILIEKFGGATGIRDKNLLESALRRPFQTFDALELYPTVIEKSAALLESLIKNHPFIDGNKRTGYVLCRLFLLQNKLDFDTDQQSKYNFIIKISTGELELEEIKIWIFKNTKSGNT